MQATNDSPFQRINLGVAVGRAPSVVSVFSDGFAVDALANAEPLVCMGNAIGNYTFFTNKHPGSFITGKLPMPVAGQEMEAMENMGTEDLIAQLDIRWAFDPLPPHDIDYGRERIWNVFERANTDFLPMDYVCCCWAVQLQFGPNAIHRTTVRQGTLRRFSRGKPKQTSIWFVSPRCETQDRSASCLEMARKLIGSYWFHVPSQSSSCYLHLFTMTCHCLATWNLALRPSNMACCKISHL